eukprot:scaffold1554_cov108-Isochrysis_galbana.AAC.4
MVSVPPQAIHGLLEPPSRGAAPRPLPPVPPPCRGSRASLAARRCAALSPARPTCPIYSAPPRHDGFSQAHLPRARPRCARAPRAPRAQGAPRRDGAPPAASRCHRAAATGSSCRLQQRKATELFC